MATAQLTEPAPQRTREAASRPRGCIEFRLALVCYGGVSLAVYMHGVTKELHKLVRASRRFDDVRDLAERNPFRDDETESVYFEALRELARAGKRLSVTVDVIAGTSAGGINGVVLGKVLALDGSQEELKGCGSRRATCASSSAASRSAGSAPGRSWRPPGCCARGSSARRTTHPHPCAASSCRSC